MDLTLRVFGYANTVPSFRVTSKEEANRLQMHCRVGGKKQIQHRCNNAEIGPRTQGMGRLQSKASSSYTDYKHTTPAQLQAHTQNMETFTSRSKLRAVAFQSDPFFVFGSNPLSLLGLVVFLGFGFGFGTSRPLEGGKNM